MGCSTSNAAQKEEAKLRKQLTLTECDAGDEPFTPVTPNTPSNPKRKADKVPLRRSFTSCSVSDSEGKSSFSEKTAITTDNDANPEGLGIYVTCRKGTKPGSPNQDSWYVRKDDGFAVYGVFDGHGKHGHDVSNFVKRHLPKLIENDQRFRGPQQNAAVTEAFDKVTRMIQVAAEKGELDPERSGTTATIAIHDPAKASLITAHVGDSGAALARGPQQKAQYLTPDHKPNLPGEMKRIKGSGGTIEFDGYNYRVFKTGECYPGLNMSRAFGDLLGRTAGVISTPDINQVKLSAGDRYLLLCSDGVWEWVLPQDAFDICHKALMSGRNPAKDLAFAASNAWVENSEVIDDITIVFVDLARSNGEACQHEPVKKAKGILRQSKTVDSIGTHTSEVTTASQNSGTASGTLAALNSANSAKAKENLRQSGTLDSIGTHTSGVTSASQTSGSMASGNVAATNSAKQDRVSLASERSTGSGSTPSIVENSNGHKDNKPNTFTKPVEALQDFRFLSFDKVLYSIPSSRGPEKPLEMPPQPSRADYVSSSV